MLESLEVASGAQTEAAPLRPRTTWRPEAPAGVDAGTQVEEGDVFDYELDVGPEAECLVGAAVEAAALHAQEELALSVIKQRREQIQQERRQEEGEVTRLEAEVVHLAAYEQAKREEKATLQRAAAARVVEEEQELMRREAAEVEAERERAEERQRLEKAAQEAAAAECVLQLSLNAWQWTLDNLWSQGTALHLLHVVPDIQPCSPASGSVYYPQPETDHERDAELVWRAAQEFLEEAYVAPARERGAEVQIVIIKEHRHKHIGWAVCAKAEELAAEPLVLAVHDQSFWEDLFLGSVSKFALKHCKCPVLLLHPSHSTLAA
eukprot:scaffold9.g2999.t1